MRSLRGALPEARGSASTRRSMSSDQHRPDRCCGSRPSGDPATSGRPINGRTLKRGPSRDGSSPGVRCRGGRVAIGAGAVDERGKPKARGAAAGRSTGTGFTQSQRWSRSYFMMSGMTKPSVTGPVPPDVEGIRRQRVLHGLIRHHRSNLGSQKPEVPLETDHIKDF